MSGKRYTEEFKIAAVKQVAQRGHPVSEVVERLGVSIHSLYAWVKRYGVPEEERKTVDVQTDDVCGGQVISDTTIGSRSVIFCS